jgi:DNA-binding transcriptional MerR regulator
MFTIGDFARLGLVSVRMLRHYDSIGLLRPERVDPFTGYRYYAVDQLPRLNRIVALKELGFTLTQVAELLDEKVGSERLQGMLQLRRAQLANQVAADTARLADVEARLRRIEREGAMPEHEVIVKSVPATTVVELTGVAASYAEVGAVIQPLYQSLGALLGERGLAADGAPIAYYEDASDGVLVHAAVVVPASAAAPDLPTVALPAIDRAATLVMRGELTDIPAAFEELARWISDSGESLVGPARELYLSCPPVDGSPEWVIELQMPIARQEATLSSS